VILGICLLSFAMAQGVPDDLIIELSKTSFDVNEAVDLTVKMVKDNGEIVKDYEWTIWIEIVELFNVWEDHILPGGWTYDFALQDQWVKTFSKWLVLKVPSRDRWFTVQVYDLFDPTIIDKKTIFVGEKEDDIKTNIQLISPTAWSVVTNSIADIIAKAAELPNSTFQIFINGVLQSESITTEKWDISGYASWFQKWENKLQIKIINSDKKVIGQSSEISFTYQTSIDDIYNGIEVLPSTDIRQWDKVTFNIKTNDQVTSVELQLSDGTTYPMDRLTAGSFSKQVLMEKAWDIEVSLSLMVVGNTKRYNSVATLKVTEKIGIWDVKFVVDSVDKKKLLVSWIPFWHISKYKVDYWTDQINLSNSVSVDTNEISLDNLDPENIYYIKISPLDALWLLIGTPSDVIKIEPWHLGPTDEPVCIVKWIAVSTGKVWDKYYLQWDAAENVEKYQIYRSDRKTTDVSKMDKLWETTDTRFEYPFNSNTRTFLYAYYVVEAICTDGWTAVIDEVKKVSVWPIDNLILVLVVSLFAYSIYRLNIVSLQ